MLKKTGPAPRCPRPIAVWLLALAATAAVASVACGSQDGDQGAAQTAAAGQAVPTAPTVLSLSPSRPPSVGTNELVLTWRAIPGIDRFVLCETRPPSGTECQDHRGVSETTVTVPGPTDDPEASGTWIKYLWLQACNASECSRPPTAAGAIVHRVVYGTGGWNFIALVRRLESGQVEVTLANASRAPAATSTLVARAPGGAEILRCDKVVSGGWCGPSQGALLSNDITAEQIYGDLGVTLNFPLVPSTTAPEGSPPAP